MLTVFKMLYRIQFLWKVLVDLVGRPEYQVASQKALKSWSDKQKATDKLIAVDGVYPDKVQHYLTGAGSTFKQRLDNFINVTN